MATILVTGGAGFIGSHVARELVDRKHRVIVLDDLSGGFAANVPAGAEFVEGSILDVELIRRLFAENSIEYVFHLAAYAAEGLSHFIRVFNYNNNLIGSVNLINAAIRHEVKCFVFTSSIAVYGEIPPPMTEESVPRPEDPYGIAKLAVENDLKAAHKMFGLPSIIFRPHNVYGEGQNIGDKYRNVIGIFMNQVMTGAPLTVFGDGSQTRAFSYIGDVAPVIAGAIENPRAYNEIFNIGADKPYTVNELIEQVSRAMGANPDVRRLEARNEVKHAYCDHQKLEGFFNHKPQYGLSAGIDRMAAWAKKAGSRQSPRFKNIEITRNLPKSWAE